MRIFNLVLASLVLGFVAIACFSLCSHTLTLAVPAIVSAALASICAGKILNEWRKKHPY